MYIQMMTYVLLLLLVCTQYTCNICQKGLNTIQYICWMKNKSDDIQLQYNNVLSKVICVYYCVLVCVLLAEDPLYPLPLHGERCCWNTQTLARGSVRAMHNIMNIYFRLLNNWLRIQTLASYIAHTIHHFY